MPAKLTTTLSKIASIPNPENAALVEEFHGYMRGNGASESHQNNSMKVAIAFAAFLGPKVAFVKRRETAWPSITNFLRLGIQGMRGHKMIIENRINHPENSFGVIKCQIVL